MRFLKWVLVLLFVPTLSFATWQVANTQHHQKYKNQYLAAQLGKTDYPKAYSDRYVFRVEKESLKWNIFQNAGKYGWSVQWKVKENYRVLNAAEVAGPTFCVALNRLLAHYPLKAQCNLSAKKVAVYPSNYPLYKHYKKIFKTSYSK